MKSIKPGRGPSMMSGIAGIFVAIFGGIWTIAAVSMGAGLFAIFGIIFIGFAITIALYNFKNATGKNRYSAFDITSDGEEPDPLNEKFGAASTEKKDTKYSFCPYCGTPVEEEYQYCNSCGKKLPQ